MADVPAFKTNLQTHIDWYDQNKENIAITTAAGFNFELVGKIFETDGPLEFGSLADLRLICSKAAAGTPLSEEMKVPRQKIQAKADKGASGGSGDIEDVGAAKGKGGNRAKSGGKGKGKGADKGNDENKPNNATFANKNRNNQNNNQPLASNNQYNNQPPPSNNQYNNQPPPSNNQYNNQAQPNYNQYGNQPQASNNQYGNQQASNQAGGGRFQNQNFTDGGSSGSNYAPPNVQGNNGASYQNNFNSVQYEQPMANFNGPQQPPVQSAMNANSNFSMHNSNNFAPNSYQQPYQNMQPGGRAPTANAKPPCEPPLKKQRTSSGTNSSNSQPTALPAGSVFELCQPFLGTGPQVQLDLSFFGEQHAWNQPYEWDTQVHGALYQMFGIPQFRHMQREIINASLSNKDIFVRMPTGGGKSLTYQLPPMISSRLAVCISPLISLMYDQVMQMEELGVPCGIIRGNNESSASENNDTYRRLQNRELLLVYVTPEMLTRSGKLQRILEDMGDYVGRFVIDEAHCLSQWGYDFRESYLELRKVRHIFPTVPILACSATATDEVMDDVARTLQMNNTQIFKSTLNRPNLQYLVLPKKKMKILDQIVDFIKSTWQNRVPSGIIYCLSRRECEKVAEELKLNYNLNAAYYHAEASADYRQQVQTQWMRNEIPIIVSTVAFGMGINKPDVEFVIHQTMPKTLEGYYQESGRAGRNGVKSICVVFYDFADKLRHDKMLTTDVQRGRLLDMIKYCETVHLCRRTLLEQYFDVNGASDVVCNLGMEICDNCAAAQNFGWDAYDYTVDAQCVVELVRAVNDNKLRGLTLLLLRDILSGSKGARVKNFLGYPHVGRYASGQANSLTGDEIIRFLRHLVCIKVLDEEIVTPANPAHAALYSYVIVGINANPGKVYFARKRKRAQQQQKQQAVVQQMQLNGLTQPQAGELRRRLKMLVDDISQREGRTTSMGCISQQGIDRVVEANPLPSNLQELSMCKTFNAERVANYGNHILECVRQFLLDFNLTHLVAPMQEPQNITITNFNGTNP